MATYEIEDTLQGHVDSAIEQVKDALLSHLDSNRDTDELPCISNDLDYSGGIHEIVDGCVPIYTKEIKDVMYLHGDEVNAAFDDAGIGDRDSEWPMGWEAAAIYCYIDQQVREWYQSEAGDVFEEWREHLDQCKAELKLLCDANENAQLLIDDAAPEVLADLAEENGFEALSKWLRANGLDGVE